MQVNFNEKILCKTAIYNNHAVDKSNVCSVLGNLASFVARSRSFIYMPDRRLLENINISRFTAAKGKIKSSKSTSLYELRYYKQVLISPKYSKVFLVVVERRSFHRHVQLFVIFNNTKMFTPQSFASTNCKQVRTIQKNQIWIF
jgi:hypothetical protein